MERAATDLFKRQSQNLALCSKLSNFYFDLRPPKGRPRGKTEEQKPDPRGNENVRIPGGIVRLGIDWYIIWVIIYPLFSAY